MHDFFQHGLANSITLESKWINAVTHPSHGKTTVLSLGKSQAQPPVICRLEFVVICNVK